MLLVCKQGLKFVVCQFDRIAVFHIVNFVFTDYTTVMPVTKTAKRALRGSKRKEIVNKITLSRLEVAIKLAKKTKSKKDIESAVSIADRASKENTIHKNKSSRIKSQLSRLIKAKPQTLPKAKK